MVKEERLNEITKIIPNVGDMAFSLDLQTNVIQTATFVLEHFDKPFSVKYLSLYLREIGTFYELFFKYKISLINKSLIWKNPKEYNEDKHNNAKFESITADSVISYAKNFGWISEEEYFLLDDFRRIRNKLTHFSACEPSTDSAVWRCEVIKNEDLITHRKLIIHLLEDSSDSLKDNPAFNRLKQEKYFMENKL